MRSCPPSGVPLLGNKQSVPGGRWSSWSSSDTRKSCLCLPKKSHARRPSAKESVRKKTDVRLRHSLTSRFGWLQASVEYNPQICAANLPVVQSPLLRLPAWRAAPPTSLWCLLGTPVDETEVTDKQSLFNLFFLSVFLSFVALPHCFRFQVHTCLLIYGGVLWFWARLML